LNRLFPVSGVSCYRSSQVARLLASVNELRKGKDAAAERLCSTVAQWMLLCRQERRQAEAARHERSGGLALHPPPVNAAAGASMAFLALL